MKIVGIISIVAALACLGYFIFRITKVVKGHVIGEEKHKIEGKERTELLVLAGITAGLFAVAALSLFLVLTKDGSGKWYEGIFSAFGALVFGGALAVGSGAFGLFYYRLDLDEKQRKFCQYAFPISIAVAVLSLFLFTEGIANHISYPLASGVSFTNGWIYGGDAGDGFKIKWYGVFIVSGALLCYAITDHMTYKKFKKHGLIDSLFIVAFLFGILGARLWYCIVLEPDIYFSGNVPPLYFLYGIVDGGLAVQGGALLGIIAGVSFMLLFRKYIDVRFMMDVAIPTILLAQAIGRIGNFFNQEVYGLVTSYENLWFLPTIIRKNMLIGGDYRVPLFFIEAVMNIGGYFIIRYLLGKVAKFHIGLGYQASSYLVWYGIVRVVLEPLRDGYVASTDSESFGYLQSYITAFIFIGVGLLMILGFYIYHRIRMNKGIEDKFGDKIETL